MGPVGANGIGLTTARNALYVSVFDTGLLLRVAIGAGGSAGAVTIIAQDAAMTGADGIAVGADGTVYVAANLMNQIVAVHPATGAVRVAASGPVFRSPAVIRFSPDHQTLYVNNFDLAVLLELAPGPARPGVLAIDAAALAPRPPAVTPPATGSGGLASAGRASAVPATAALVPAALLAGAALALRRRFHP